MEQTWSEAGLRTLRVAIHSGDAPALLTALRSGPARAVLQLAGDSLAAASARRVPGANAAAAEFIEHLTGRDWDSDAELVELLSSSIGAAPVPPGHALPVDLEELTMFLEGDPAQGGGRLDLTTGTCHPEEAAWLADDTEDREDPDHWLHVPCHGSRPGYRDIEEFIATLDDESLADRLQIAIRGRGAFRRFKDVLTRDEHARRAYHLYSDERQRGRARAWLTDQGYRPLPTAGS
ncbi:hypothetical protein ABZV67_31280 [Streptomyces sp. NPDC005065]|uniref:hypothetical protein n=1 Tax=unclassified Streptomyces TaxID=2593676 RepID=UPI0033B3FA4A